MFLPEWRPPGGGNPLLRLIALQGPASPAGRGPSPPMSRFFKSAAFPILIVVVLAFFAQKLISPGTQHEKPDFSQFLTQLDNGQVKSADAQDQGQHGRRSRQGRRGKKYEVGYDPDYGNELINRLSAPTRSTSTSRAASPTAGSRC